MNRARSGAIGALLITFTGAAIMDLTARQHSRAAEKPTLALLTSLPIVLGEDFSLSSNGSRALAELQSEFHVAPISVTSAEELGKARLLLMAQPMAQAPENLVALDEWVRRGGRVLLLADPLLEWQSQRPFGDPLRAAPTFADTGLLAHWGLRLDAPDQRGPAVRNLSGNRVLTVSPGALYGSCAISADRLVAYCRIGSGRATVVADADLLNVEALGPEGKNNLHAITVELSRLNNLRFAQSQTYPQR